MYEEVGLTLQARCLLLARAPFPVGEQALVAGRRQAVVRLQVGAQTAQTVAGGPAGQPLFVVDPGGDLAGAERSLPAYRRLFPAARILRGGEASREAVSRALAGAEWLHIDAHASYAPVFPEMSRLQLAGGTLSLIEWSRLPAPRRFANLSGCRTASGPLLFSFPPAPPHSSMWCAISQPRASSLPKPRALRFQ